MRKVLLTVVLTLQAFVYSLTQELPLVYDVENTASDYPTPPLLSIEQLPVILNLPDPFQWSDGRGRISSIYDWQYRRNEIADEIQYYEIGVKPSRPDTITANYADGVLTVNVTENGKTLVLSSQVLLPEGSGPFPAIIGMNSPSGSVPANILTERNIARITYSHNNVTTYGAPSSANPYYQLYPYLNPTNTGQYSAWAWGVSRLIDGLELVQNVLPIDLEHLAVTGCSYAGKMALFCGALDERIALTISVESGGGGYTTWRYSQEIDKTVSVETLSKTDYNWFKDDMKNFGTQVSKLPHDHHELMAMVAPRALLVTGNPDYVWLADESGHVGSNAAKKVYEALGIPDRFGYSIVSGHSHCAIPNSQIPEISAFLDKFLLGINTANTNVATTPFSTNLAPWISWDTPTLSDDQSAITWISLVSPSNQSEGLDNDLTFSWKGAEDAAIYYFQLSLSPSFNSLEVNDSTADTTITINNLKDGGRYYWRVRIKSTTGTKGPWSEQWSFSTYIPLPAKPELVSATTMPDRADYVTITWIPAEFASNYNIQFSYTDAFTTFFKRDSTADTTKTLSGFFEGRKYFWRVQSKNVTGLSAWSDPATFLDFLAPGELKLDKSGDNAITLSWEDYSNVEEGYIIERKIGTEGSFIIVDTSAENTNAYTDDNVTQSDTYTYRVIAYKDSLFSGYSNEASLNIVSVTEGRMPAEFSVSQNYPNPFNPVTKIKFALPKASHTKVSVYDLLGKEVDLLLNGEVGAGYHEINFDAESFPSGVYFYRVQSGEFISTMKMVLMK